MIRVWLSRRRTVAEAQIDLRDGQIEGLRDALAEANQLLAEEKAARARDVAQLQKALAPYLMDVWRRQGIALSRRLAEEPTAHVTREQLARSRPMDAPTEQYDRRPR